MTPHKAQRIRFGILAARHALERDRLAPWQVDYLEGCEASGWTPLDAHKAYSRETNAALTRMLPKKMRPL